MFRSAFADVHEDILEEVGVGPSSNCPTPADHASSRSLQRLYTTPPANASDVMSAGWVCTLLLRRAIMHQNANDKQETASAHAQKA